MKELFGLIIAPLPILANCRMNVSCLGLDDCLHKLGKEAVCI